MSYEIVLNVACSSFHVSHAVTYGRKKHILMKAADVFPAPEPQVGN